MTDVPRPPELPPGCAWFVPISRIGPYVVALRREGDDVPDDVAQQRLADVMQRRARITTDDRERGQWRARKGTAGEIAGYYRRAGALYVVTEIHVRRGPIARL